MSYYNWDFSVITTYKLAILKGTVMTIGLTLTSLLLGTCFGLILCFMKISRNPAPKLLAKIIIDTFTGLPLLVLLVWLYYALPIFTGIHISAFVTAVMALSLNLGGFSAEIFRAGIQSVPTGQVEAAISLGMTRWHTLRRIVLPQAVKVIIPPLSGRYIETIKLTSLASIIAVDELLHSGQNLISISFRPLEIYTAIAFIYLAMIIPLTLFLRRFENVH